MPQALHELQLGNSNKESKARSSRKTGIRKQYWIGDIKRVFPELPEGKDMKTGKMTKKCLPTPEKRKFNQGL